MLNNKKVLIMGMGLTGKSALKALSQMPCKVYVYDENKNLNLSNIKEDFVIFKDEDLKDIDLIIKSPGIYPDHDLLVKARDENIEVISDLEFAYRITKCKNLIAITGTNGKTTTTTLLGDILKRVRKTYVGGNIGVGLSDIALEAKKDDFFVIEASSFQLEDTLTFKPKIAILTYVTKDHLDWHKSEDNYVRAKYKIFANQDGEDYAILNSEDRAARDLKKLKSKVLYFSAKNNNIEGAFLKDKAIYVRLRGREEKIIDIKDIKIPGIHNAKNIMAAILAAKILKVDDEIIIDAVKKFTGVAHRIEFIKEIKGVKYYNDSKGTNPDSTLVAVEAMDQNCILIAGGYDKGSDFDDLFKKASSKISHLILMGQTAEKISLAAKKYNIDYYLVENLQMAVTTAKNLAKKGDSILLSPACASWDMYKSYEERGEDFQKIVSELI